MDQSTEKTPESAATNTESHPNGTAAQSAELNPQLKRIAELEAQVKEKEQRYVYLYADFENYKKRMIKERSDLIKFGFENAARELLEVVDNLERALEHMPKTEDKSYKTLELGLQMVLTQFHSSLEKQGVQRIQAASQTFDPHLHEAVAHLDSEEPAGKVIREESGGYTLHGRLLRPARVVISNGAPAIKPVE